MATAQQPERSSPADYRTDERMSKGTREFLAALNDPAPPELEKLTPVEARQVLVDAQAGVNVDYSGIEESERVIETGGFSIKLNLVRPAGRTGKLPIFVFIHGGGWVLGDYPTHRRLVRDLVVESGYASAFINYTPTPDAVYPAQIDQIYAAVKWISENGDVIDADVSKLAIAGNSVGGNMTAVTAIKAIENGGPKISSLVMMWPLTDTDTERGSYHKFGEARFLSKPLMEWMFGLYAKDEELRDSYYIAPLRAPDDVLAKFPPTLIQVAENDILNEEGEAFGRRLNELGVDVTTVTYDGMIHDFGMLNALAGESGTRSLIKHAAAELKSRLA